MKHVFQPGEEKTPGRPYCGFSVPKRSLKEGWEKLFGGAYCVGTGDDDFKLGEGGFRLDVKETFFTMLNWIGFSNLSKMKQHIFLNP